MRIRDIVARLTYLVRVPEDLPPARYPLAALGPALYREYGRLRGPAFALPVTDTAAVITGILMVDGLCVVASGGIEAERSDEVVGERA
ncbi:hypothetical protein [Streptosporangium sandarakinum]|uniref:hypothetical protein n=1 Tax=Streptosporangium sandarakinum TaxID=1260955 RepID=UPI0036B875C6